MGFVTMMSYDTIYDYLPKGIGRQIQTDVHAFNFWSGAAYVFGYKDFLERQQCLGMHNSHYYMFNYAWQFLNNYSKINKFSYLHLSTAHEESGTVIKTLDDDFVEYIDKVLTYFKQNKDEDTVILLGSDHGKHTREWDKSFEGYIENKLPFQFLIANKQFISNLGENVDKNLKTNTKRLIGRYDWHLTLKHLAVAPYGKLEKNSELYND